MGANPLFSSSSSSAPPSLLFLSSLLHQPLPSQSSDPGNESNPSFPPHYFPSSSSLSPPPVFLYTLPSSSYSIFILILCHLTPTTPPPPPFLSLPFISLSLSRQSFFPSASVLSQSLSTSLLAASPPCFLLTHTRLPLPPALHRELTGNMSFSVRQAWRRLRACERYRRPCRRSRFNSILAVLQRAAKGM